MINAARKGANIDLGKFLDAEAELISSEGTKRRYSVDGGFQLKLERKVRRVASADMAKSLVPRGLLVAMVSQFDAYVGALVRQLFKLKPAIVDSSSDLLTFAQLTQFGSIENARDYVIDKEVEAILRKSHGEQFDYFEKRFDIKLRKDLSVWQIFVELTERRNLFVHTNGVISNQYLEVCRQHACNLPDEASLGKQLSLTADYFSNCYECLLEVGVKLGQVLWRKVQPADLSGADSNLADITLSLIVEEKYALARILLDFGTEVLKKHSNEEMRLMFVVNRAQTYKWSGNNESCIQILDAIDWSATALKFKLAAAVLRDDFGKANALVKQIGKNGELGKHDYREWPLFKEFRRSREFAEVFHEIFSEPLNKITFDKSEIVDGSPNIN